jgi:hypothetical protein
MNEGKALVYAYLLDGKGGDTSLSKKNQKKANILRSA